MNGTKREMGQTTTSHAPCGSGRAVFGDGGRPGAPAECDDAGLDRPFPDLARVAGALRPMLGPPDRALGCAKDRRGEVPLAALALGGRVGYRTLLAQIRHVRSQPTTPAGSGHYDPGPALFGFGSADFRSVPLHNGQQTTDAVRIVAQHLIALLYAEPGYQASTPARWRWSHSFRWTNSLRSLFSMRTLNIDQAALPANHRTFTAIGNQRTSGMVLRGFLPAAGGDHDTKPGRRPAG